MAGITETPFNWRQDRGLNKRQNLELEKPDTVSGTLDFWSENAISQITKKLREEAVFSLKRLQIWIEKVESTSALNSLVEKVTSIKTTLLARLRENFGNDSSQILNEANLNWGES